MASRAERRRRARAPGEESAQGAPAAGLDYLEQLEALEGEKVGDEPSEERLEARESAEERLERDIRAISPEPQPRMAPERLEQRIKFARDPRTGKMWGPDYCPKRPGTTAYDNWHLYVDGMTVSAYLASHDRRRARTDLRWDLDHGFIYLQTPGEWAREQADRMSAREEETSNV